MTRDERTDAPDLFVRPLGYVEDRAVARRVGDRDLFVGNGRAADTPDHEGRFDHVLSVCRDGYPLTTHHRPLTDGPGNDWTAFASAVDTARRLYRRGGSLLIHCNAGISRSSTVVAAAVAVEEDRRFVDALHEVQDARPHAVPNPALHELGVLYVAADVLSKPITDET